MAVTIGINGFGRIGRLALRVAIESSPNTEFIIKRINDPGGDANTLAHLYNYDSVHGRARVQAEGFDKSITLANQQISFSQKRKIDEVDWSDCDLVLESSGQFRKVEQLRNYLQQGVGKVLVSAPVQEAGALNLVMGVNHHQYRPEQHHLVTAASCTTNCLAPVVKVIHEEFGISHGSFTTIHDLTNTQTILDAPHKDLRRARACGMSMIPTTTGSATAITQIFPELKNKLNGHAVRVPLANASLTDCSFELQEDVTAAQVNQALESAADSDLNGILAVQQLPLVSIDYRTNPHSATVDSLSTMVVNKRHLKLYLWYDNEWGYANRCVELMELMTQQS